jgi:peroxiredoxin Q/BCP
MTTLLLLLSILASPAPAAEVMIGAEAPPFTLQTQDGKEFTLASRKGHWTVLYFYPKADTPGCTKQACAFRDKMGAIRKLGAEVVGVSVNSVAEQKAFHSKYKMNFTLLADADGKVATLYGAKLPLLPVAKRWTFIIDPALIVRAIEHDVDPARDADHVAARLENLQKK